MVSPATPEGSTVLTATPPATPAPETVLFPATPPAVTPPAVTPPVETPPVVTPPVTAPVPEVKPPTEPPKPEVKPTPTPAPTDYDLKLPEGSPLSEEDRAQTLKDAKAAGLSKEQAETLLTSKDQGARALETRQKQAFEETKTAWKEAIAKDPEMGGDKHAETVTLANRAFKTLASAELQMWADKTGLGNYPEFVRLMAKVGSMMAEDKLVRGTVGSTPTAKTREEILYGKTTPGADGKVSS